MQRPRDGQHRPSHLVVSQDPGAFGPVAVDRPLVSTHLLAFFIPPGSLSAPRRRCGAPSWRKERGGRAAVGLLLGLAALLLSLVAGCRSDDYLTLRPVPRNPLTDSLKLVSAHQAAPSERTQRLLVQYGWDKQYKTDRRGVLREMQQTLAREPTGSMAVAFAELAYLEGFRKDTLGQGERALEWYSASLLAAYDYLFDPRFDVVRNPYDPEFRRACDLYNGSLEGALRLLNADGRLVASGEQDIQTGAIHCRLRTVWSGPLDPREIERFEFASDYEITGLRNHHVTYGLGVPLIAVRRPHEGTDEPGPRVPRTMSFPVTAFVRIAGRRDAVSGAPSLVELIFFDPLRSTDIVLSGRRVPLESDITTPLAFTLDSPALRESRKINTLGLLFPDRVEDYRGIYMIDPYDPHKIPVLMVHGLWSSPLTWMEMFNDLRAYPELREHYQFWFYLYPTGPPYWESAAQFRTDLATLREKLDPQHQNRKLDQMVLVGHSMGGLVSRLQVIDSGDRFWSVVSAKPVHQLDASPEDKQRIAQIAFFQANPSVRRVITIATPHRGSDFANDWTTYFARKLIRLPKRVLAVRHELVRKNRDAIRAPELFEHPTSIDSLSPKSPFFEVLAATEPAPWVRLHNIVGVVEENSWLRWVHDDRGDGVVDFESAHLDGAVSELIVDADHQNVQRHPRAILEVRRILLEHLNEVDLRQYPVQPAGSEATPDPTALYPTTPYQITTASAGTVAVHPAPSSRSSSSLSNSRSPPSRSP